jgi:hypothetical protein
LSERTVFIPATLDRRIQTKTCPMFPSIFHHFLLRIHRTHASDSTSEEHSLLRLFSLTLPRAKEQLRSTSTSTANPAIMSSKFKQKSLLRVCSQNSWKSKKKLTLPGRRIGNRPGWMRKPSELSGMNLWSQYLYSQSLRSSK